MKISQLVQKFKDEYVHIQNQHILHKSVVVLQRFV